MAKRAFGERVYRRLLRLYPRDFSDDYADEMTRLYRDRVRDEGTTSVWLAFGADLARTAPKNRSGHSPRTCGMPGGLGGGRPFSRWPRS